MILSTFIHFFSLNSENIKFVTTICFSQLQFKIKKSSLDNKYFIALFFFNSFSYSLDRVFSFCFVTTFFYSFLHFSSLALVLSSPLFIWIIQKMIDILRHITFPHSNWKFYSPNLSITMGSKCLIQTVKSSLALSRQNSITDSSAFEPS